MDLLEFSNVLVDIINDLTANRTGESVQIANESVELVRLRVQNSKETADGGSFGQYSEAKVPKWFFRGKSLSNGADERIRKGPSFISYSDFRDANNLPTDSINFTFSGDMWRNTGVTGIEESEFETSVNVGGQTTRAKELLGFHAERFGSLLEMSEKEVQFIVNAHSERISNTLSKFLQ